MSQNNSTALVKTPVAELQVTTSSDVSTVSAQLQRLEQSCILLGPASCGAILPGYSVAFSQVTINPNTEFNEVYSESGGLALTKSSLIRIAAARGVKPDKKACWVRYDPKTDPYICAAHYEGSYIDFDGTEIPLIGDRVMDLTDGGKDAKAMTPAQLAKTRQFIVEHTQTKAMLRAFRTIPGIKSKYNKEELEKPFVAPKMQFSGLTDDPILKREFGRAIAERALGAKLSLYGEPPSPETQRPADVTVELHPVQEIDPSDASAIDADDDPFSEEVEELRSDGLVKFGKVNKGKRYIDLPREELNRIDAIYQKVLDDNEQVSNHAQANAELKAIRDAIAHAEAA